MWINTNSLNIFSSMMKILLHTERDGGATPSLSHTVVSIRMVAITIA